MSTTGYRERLKSTIVKVARELLASDGLQGLQARRVARGADCSVGTIYNLFGSLDMVVIAANSETLGELHQELIAAKQNTPGFDAQLRALAQTYLGFAVGRTLEWRAVFDHRFTTRTVLPTWYVESQAELFAVVEDILADVIQDRQERMESARALFSAVHGVISLSLDQKLGEFNRETTERQVGFIVNSVARGLGPPDTSSVAAAL